MAAPTLSHLVEDAQGARGQVWTVRNRRFHRPLPDYVADGCESGQHHAVEQCLDRRQWAEQEAHERRELDVSESQRLGLEYQRAQEREEGEQETRHYAARESCPPRVVEDAGGEGKRHAREDDSVEDEPVLEVEED